MNEEAGSQKLFLAGIGLLGALIIGGLVWAIMMPSAPAGKTTAPGVFSDVNDPVTGSSTSKVVLRVFGDFQCPACATAEPGVTYVRKTYGDRVKIVWNDFPLSEVHPNAMSAAIAARCAEDQGKFWEYHDMLYQAQKAWSVEKDPKDLFVTYAKSIGVNDAAAFAQCYDAQTDRQKIQSDMDEGLSNEVSGTPTFFINNKKYVGGMENAQWDTEIKAAIGGS